MIGGIASLGSGGLLELLALLLLFIQVCGQAALHLLIIAMLLVGSDKTIQGVKQRGLVIWLWGDDEDLSRDSCRRQSCMPLRARGGEDRGLV